MRVAGNRTEKGVRAQGGSEGASRRYVHATGVIGNSSSVASLVLATYRPEASPRIYADWEFDGANPGPTAPGRGVRGRGRGALPGRRDERGCGSGFVWEGVIYARV